MSCVCVTGALGGTQLFAPVFTFALPCPTPALPCPYVPSLVLVAAALLCSSCCKPPMAGGCAGKGGPPVPAACPLVRIPCLHTSPCLDLTLLALSCPPKVAPLSLSLSLGALCSPVRTGCGRRQVLRIRRPSCSVPSSHLPGSSSNTLFTNPLRSSLFLNPFLV